MRTPIPRRHDTPPERGLLIVAHSTHKQKGLFFFLVQSELGDLYRVSLDFDDDVVTNVRVKYFDTIPVANSLCITRNGFLFAASEFGNQYVGFWVCWWVCSAACRLTLVAFPHNSALYMFVAIGDDDDDAYEASAVDDESDEVVVPVFRPRVLTNLKSVDDMASLAPVHEPS